jgi:hypothetical protein
VAVLPRTRIRILLLAGLLGASGCPAAPPQQVPPTEEIYQPGPELTERGMGGGQAPPVARDAGSRLAMGDDAAPSARLPAGEVCFDGGECESGVCEGEGCGTNQPGTCVASGRVCKGPIETFCGCDGETFRAPRDCPGQPYAKRGACRAR